MVTRKAWAALGGFVVVAAAAGAIVVATSGGGAGSQRIHVSDGDGCAPGWAVSGSGRTVFDVQNTSPHTVFSVQLINAANAKVYGKLNMVAPGTDVPLDVLLPPGRYSFHCLGSDGYTYDSKVGDVRGPAVSAARSLTPVSPLELAEAMQTYRVSLKPVMAQLVVDTDRLTNAVREGRLARARALWLPAHLDYARLGVAYGTFGKFNDEIDGRPLGLVQGVHDPQFQGFLRLEYGLWHGQSRQELTPVATALGLAVHTVARQFQTFQTLNWTNTDLPLRAHEILENTLQFELTGETNEGSNTNLATAWASAQGESLALDALKPLLRRRDPVLLAGATTATTRLAASLRAYERPRGAWTGVSSLSTREREQLDGAMSKLLEQLEQIPGELELQLATPSGADND
ncbi:MAG TPA: EfeM/EfeO family lipoprotein [Gaiellaceae bacterium]|nr:EfeM/EfeO family lipoprotein [Gaiellaceae bacterium]